MLRRIVKGTILVGAVVLASAFGVHIVNRDSEIASTDHTGSLFSLAIPAFAQNADVDQFPNNEVGICAYVELEQMIDLSRAETVYSGIEASETEYIIGTVELPNLTEDMWPHVYISSSGWIMAYYPKTEPTSRLVQWIGYQRDDITTTTLRDALIQVSQQIGISTAAVGSSMAYYHFRYPDATKLLIAVDTTTGTDTFTYTIPFGLNLYEASWSHYALSLGTYDSCYIDIDSARMYGGGSGTHLACGSLETQYTAPDIAHQVKIHCTRNWAGAAIVFLYQ